MAGNFASVLNATPAKVAYVKLDLSVGTPAFGLLRPLARAPGRNNLFFETRGLFLHRATVCHLGELILELLVAHLHDHEVWHLARARGCDPNSAMWSAMPCAEWRASSNPTLSVSTSRCCIGLGLGSATPRPRTSEQPKPRTYEYRPRRCCATRTPAALPSRAGQAPDSAPASPMLRLWGTAPCRRVRPLGAPHPNPSAPLPKSLGSPRTSANPSSTMHLDAPRDCGDEMLRGDGAQAGGCRGREATASPGRS